MLWHPSIAPQRHAPRGEVATTYAGQSGILTEPKQHSSRERWRS